MTTCPPNRRCTFVRSSLALLAVALACLQSLGCSSFNQKWDELAIHEKKEPVISSRWEGIWRSDVNGHEGKLRCIVLPAENAMSLFRFSATWGPGIVSDYDIQMKVQQGADGSETFEGELDLGMFMGNYKCKGTITGDAFAATYDSSQDQGIFEMQRVK